MKPVYYDLHIHSCLSPCGDQDMTPNNILNMALIKELDMIALTDHNSCQNCPALLEAAAGSGLTVIPGMELTTAEEVHVVCLFPMLQAAMAFDEYVYGKLMEVQNVPEIFGEQTIMNALDEPIGALDKLLVNATAIEIAAVPALVAGYGGVCFPAHIDRSSNSVLSNLGYIPPECGFQTVEVYRPTIFFANGAHSEYKQAYHILTDSDAHYLEHISERERCIHLEQPGFAGLAERILKGALV